MLQDSLPFLRRALLFGTALWLLSACLASRSAAQGDGAGIPVIGRVSVAGVVYTDSTRILRTFEVLPGQRFSQDAIRRGVRKLVALGLFSDVKVNRNEHDGVIDLVVVVTERPRIGAIAYSGNKKREDVDLEKKTFLRPGDTYSASQARTQVDSLTRYYRDEGFTRAKVTTRVDTLQARNEVNLTFLVDEGEKVKITAIVFEGLEAGREAKLRKAMKTKKRGWIGGGDVKDESFAEDREKLERWYHDHGFRDMNVAGFELVQGLTPRDLVLKVRVEEGPLYVFGNVEWTGNRVVHSTPLKRQWTGRPGDLYERSLIERATAGAYGEYAEYGYLYLSVEPRETVRDSVVDITFIVTEGAPSRIRRISILGNKGTREHVIRRELAIHEGDLFRRSALMRSQGDIMRLGLFEEAIPDFTPAESTDVDLVFKLKEKQVGTASAGAGYTGETGVTGFLELGHNNVLGNGQSLALHIERGGRRQDYSVSFTEPWFHDAPTLLGFSGYSTTQVLPEYQQRRAGGSVRIGRPLPWPDYSRGSVSYTLENVLISNVRDSLALTGVTIDENQLTSRINLSFMRNSTDNPFYATKGTRLTANEDFSGGPLGGDISYHSHRYEGRAYLPSIFRRMTTMARLRVGLMGQYPWRTGPVPDYARFRLGGATTPDPLRGYVDNQIVPDENIRTDWNKFIRTVSRPGGADTAFVDSVLVTRRYPGGRYLGLVTVEQQFAVVHPLHAVLFFDAGNVWNDLEDIRPFDLKMGAGIGFRMEIPILGNIGFDYGYGFDRDDGPKWAGHFLMGNFGF